MRLMVGRDVAREGGRPYEARAPRLVVGGLRTQRFPQHEISFEVGRGEIVGLAGLVGAGRTEVAQSIFGVHPPRGGRGDARRRSRAFRLPPRRRFEAGLYLAPEDRRREGRLDDDDRARERDAARDGAVLARRDSSGRPARESRRRTHEGPPAHQERRQWSRRCAD